jgi:hypothetical protein
MGELIGSIAAEKLSCVRYLACESKRSVVCRRLDCHKEIIVVKSTSRYCIWNHLYPLLQEPITLAIDFAPHLYFAPC